jgi:hypothetical protein
MRCPCCDGPKLRPHYLCRTCWAGLPAPARRALNRRDSTARLRLLELHRQLADGVTLEQIQITD